MAELAATTVDNFDDELDKRSLRSLSESGSSDSSVEDDGDFLQGFGRLDMLRQLGLMMGLAVSVALGFAVVLWSQTDEYQPIFADMNGYDTAVIVELLDSQAIDFTMDPTSRMILVQSDQLPAVRMLLSSAGVERFDGVGYELLDEDAGLGSSKFMEANRIKRSQEGELQRTIANFRNVQSARVHIAIPERSVFVRDNMLPTASVFLTLSGNAALSESQVRAISNLVASSVPELSSDRVTVVDQRGRLLTEQGGESTLEVADKQFEYVRKFERSLLERINGILLPIAGPENFSAQVTAAIDFTRLEAASENFDPDTRVVRSEQLMQEQSLGPSANQGVPGALSNQPPLSGIAPEEVGEEDADGQTTTGNRREQTNRNYELGRSISYTNHDPVSLNRLSVAVVLNNRTGAGEAESLPWSEEELQQVTLLVKNAVGFQEERGDSVSVINNSFTQPQAFTAEEIPIWQQPWVGGAVRQLLAGLFVILIALGVLRPVLKNLSSSETESRELALAASRSEFADLDVIAQSAGEDDVQLTTAEDELLPGPQDGYDRQLNAVKGLVSEDPERVAQVVKQWINSDA